CCRATGKMRDSSPREADLLPSGWHLPGWRTVRGQRRVVKACCQGVLSRRVVLVVAAPTYETTGSLRRCEAPRPRLLVPTLALGRRDSSRAGNLLLAQLLGEILLAEAPIEAAKHLVELPACKLLATLEVLDGHLPQRPGACCRDRA